MNPLSAQAQSSVAMGAAELSHGYRLTSDIAQFCLPDSSRDANRRLAYVNSICFLFLVIGLIGFQQPKVVQKELPPLPEIVPVVYTPPEEQPKPEPQPQPDEPEPQPQNVVDMPKIATVVAADPSQVKFAIPVQGPVIFAPAQFAAPPATPPKPTTRTVQKLTDAVGGTRPNPPYPRSALEQRQEGTVIVVITVNPDGSIQAVEVKKSSGYFTLDRHVVNWIKEKFKFLPIETNEVRLYEKDFEFSVK
jgi:TonB family protein